jgi:7-keto-8-aminopelargonate synthetase-like enzyme
MGPTGRGTAELFGVDRQDVEFWMGTLSKSFGSCGGFIAGRSTLVEYLRYTTPGFVYAAGLPPPNVGAALGSLRIMKREPQRVDRLRSNSQLFLSLARSHGLDTGLSGESPIIPVITGDSIKALRLSEALFHAGINAQPILHPAVEERKARIRFFITSEHSEAQIRSTIEIICREWNRIQGLADAADVSHIRKTLSARS